MSRPAPVYFLSYDGRNVAVYTQAFRVLAFMKLLLRDDPFYSKSLFKVTRVGIAHGHEFKLTSSDVTLSFLKFV